MEYGYVIGVFMIALGLVIVFGLIVGFVSRYLHKRQEESEKLTRSF